MPIMMQLGDIQFQVNELPHQTLKRMTAWRWPQQDRIGRRPAHQWMGKAEETITMAGMLYPMITGGPSRLRELRAEADRGEPLTLVDSFGNVWGEWVVKSVEETWEELLDNGLPRKIAFQITLSHYGDDAGSMP